MWLETPGFSGQSEQPLDRGQHTAQDKRHQLFSRKGLCGYSQGSGEFSRNKRFLPLNTCFHLEKRINVINIYMFKD